MVTSEKHHGCDFKTQGYTLQYFQNSKPKFLHHLKSLKHEGILSLLLYKRHSPCNFGNYSSMTTLKSVYIYMT